MGLQLAALGLVWINHRDAAAAARQHDGNIGAHGSAADNDCMNVFRMGGQQRQKRSFAGKC